MKHFILLETNKSIWKRSDLNGWLFDHLWYEGTHDTMYHPVKLTRDIIDLPATLISIYDLKSSERISRKWTKI